MAPSNSDDEVPYDLFADPPDFYAPSPKPTTETHVMLSGQILSLRLVGHNPLWGHHLWQAGRIISSYLEKHSDLITHKTILELGAGAGLPSLVCTLLGAKMVVVTDYPDAELIENLRHNIEHFLDISSPAESGDGHGGSSVKATVLASGTTRQDIEGKIVAEPYLWGADPTPLLLHLLLLNSAAPSSPPSISPSPSPRFEVLILADLLFNHSEHSKLVSTISNTLSQSSNAKALVFFTPYRPWLLEKDMDFFRVCEERGLRVEKVLEERMESVMFAEDRGDEEVRRTVFGFVVRWGGRQKGDETREGH